MTTPKATKPVAKRKKVVRRKPAAATPPPLKLVENEDAPKVAPKKNATKKKASKKATTKKSTSADVNGLDADEARKRVGAIYKLEAEVEKKRAAYEIAATVAKSKREELKLAEEALAKEIHDQRVGPGPLFEGAES